MIERVGETYVILNDVLDSLTAHKDDLADIVKLLIDEHGNEKLATYTGGAPVDDAAYKLSMNILESFNDIVDEFETSFRTICLLLPYVAMVSPGKTTDAPDQGI